MNGVADPSWVDTAIDTEVQFDHLFTWVAQELPQYSVADLRRTPIHKFFRLVFEAEDKQRAKLKRVRPQDPGRG